MKNKQRHQFLWYQKVGEGKWSHQTCISSYISALLEKVLATISPPVPDETDNHINELIKRELIQTFVYKKTNNHNKSDKILSKRTWNETNIVGKFFTVLYRDHIEHVPLAKKQEIIALVKKYTTFEELKSTNTTPSLLQDNGESYTRQSPKDILNTIQRIKKQRKFFSAVKTWKIKLWQFLPNDYYGS